MLLLAALVSVGAVSCHPNPANYTHPVGYIPCQTSFDCPWHPGVRVYCGFVGVDTYAVCKYN
jgi:hypothetical protein